MRNVLLKMVVVMIFIALLVPGVRAENNPRTFSQEELAQMMAPIALYPDTLLSQILMAATYPFEVVEAERWVTKNPYLKGSALNEALSEKDWDVSVLALCHYPKVLTMMSDNLSWTAGVGDAFTNQQQDVMGTVQDLRARARAAGNLASSPQQKVIVEERYIRIEPVAQDYIYIPAYDPYVVYGTWWLPLFPPVAIILPGIVVSGPGVYFSPRFYVGFGVFGWSSFSWVDHHVVIVDINRTRHYHRRYSDYRRWEHRPWRPDHDRRYIRERRGGEIPPFRPPVKPVPPDRRWDRQPDGHRSPDNKTIQPRPSDRNKQPVGLQPGDRNPKTGDPGDVKREKKPQWSQPGPEDQKNPKTITPRIRDGNKSPSSEPGAGERMQPIRRDRSGMDGIEPWNQAPGNERGTTPVGPGRRPEIRSNPRDVPSPARPEAVHGPGERGNRVERGGMMREDRKP